MLERVFVVLAGGAPGSTPAVRPGSGNRAECWRASGVASRGGSVKNVDTDFIALFFESRVQNRKIVGLSWPNNYTLSYPPLQFGRRLRMQCTLE